MITNPLRADPSRTGTLQRRLSEGLTKRFNAVIKLLTLAIEKQDALGLRRPTLNAPNWSFHTSQQKIDNFEKWIEKELTKILDEKDINSGLTWWELYIQHAYKQGGGRSFDDIKRKGKKQDKMEWYMGGREQFINSAFNNMVSTERLKILIGRTYKAMKGLTDATKTQLTQELTQGLILGLSPREIAKRLAARTTISKSRALTIARTEIVRAHAEGQLQALKTLGVDKIGVDVEFVTAKNPCPKCQALRGRIFNIEDAEGVIPVHPNCRCAFIPAVGEPPLPQKEYKRRKLNEAIKSAVRRNKR